MKDQIQPIGLKDVFNDYVERRRNGMLPDEATRQVQTMAELIPRSERNQLAAMVREWELKEGPKFRPTQLIEKQRTPTANQPVMEAVTNTNAPKQPRCPHCGMPARIGEITCPSCGNPLKANRANTRALGGDSGNNRPLAMTATLNPATRLFLIVRGYIQPIELDGGDDLVIGRSTNDSPIQPDIDLSPYQAAEMGVSRLHATFKRFHNTVSLMDMDSVNRTFINGQRLHPHEIRVLHDDDEIRLGKLTLKLKFKRN